MEFTDLQIFGAAVTTIVSFGSVIYFLIKKTKKKN
jgi:hypothetical protein